MGLNKSYNISIYKIQNQTSFDYICQPKKVKDGTKKGTQTKQQMKIKKGIKKHLVLKICCAYF